MERELLLMSQLKSTMQQMPALKFHRVRTMNQKETVHIKKIERLLKTWQSGTVLCCTCTIVAFNVHRWLLVAHMSISIDRRLNICQA